MTRSPPTCRASNRRPDCRKAFIDHLVNWEHVEQMFEGAGSKVSRAA
jgi:hypothetical protein